MSRKLLAFLLNELEIIRVKCKGCKTVLEMPIDNLTFARVAACCPACNAPFVVTGGENQLGQLVAAIRGIQASKLAVEVEFVLPDTSP